MAVTHSKVSAVADGGDTDLVRPSDWNADHDVSLTAADVGAAPDSVDYLVGTASGGLSGEIAVGTSPGGELGGTWASPTVDATHSGSEHVQIAGDLAGTAATPTVKSATNSFALPNVETISATGTQNDLAVASTTAIVHWTGASGVTVSGITNGATGRVLLWVNNQPSSTTTFTHDDAGSTSTNRIYCPEQVSFVVRGRMAVWLVYEGSRWRLTTANIDTAAGAIVTVDGTPTTGTAGYAAASGHGHRVNTSSANPVALGTVSPGSSGSMSRGDHVHPTTGLVTTSTSAGGDLAGTYPDPTVRKASKSFQLTNDETSTLTGAQDNVTLGTDTTVFRWNGASDATFTGMTRGADGDIVVLQNVTTANTLTLSHNVTSTAVNRFLLPGSVAMAIGPNASVILTYDATSQRWRASSQSAASAGGDLAGTYPNPTVAQASKSFALTNDETSTLNGAQDNVTLGADTTVFRYNGASGAAFTGLTGGVDGRVVIIHNVSTTQILTLSHDTTSTAANRFFLPNSVSLWTLRPNHSVMLMYDGTSSRWRVLDEAVEAAAGANITLDGGGSTGTAGSAAAAGHGHRLNTYSSAAEPIGNAAAGTSTTAPSRGDHSHNTGAGTPSTQAMGDSAATGTGPAAAMTDHKHAMPARGYGLASNSTPAVSLDTAEAFCTATTSISAATYADITGASVTLAAGTWLIMAFANFSMVTTTAGMLHLAITLNDNTLVCEGSQGVPAGTATVAQNGNVALSAIVTPGSSTTYKLRGARGTTTYTSTVVVMDGTGVNTANNTTNGSDKGTSIRAIRIA